MRTFLATHWKSIVVIVILVLLAVFTLTPTAASPDLAARLRAHAQAIAAGGHAASSHAALQRAARHIEATLAAGGYQVRRQYTARGQTVHNIEVSVANVAAGARPQRIFIIGAHYAAVPGDDGSGTAIVLELARLLKAVQPGLGTELKFVFLPAGGTERDADSADFIAFAGRLDASRTVRQALAAFRAASDAPPQGLATPAYVEGVILSEPGAAGRGDYPAVMVTDTAFLRYPFVHTRADAEDKVDYESMARVVEDVARTIAALTGGTRT